MKKMRWIILTVIVVFAGYSIIAGHYNRAAKALAVSTAEQYVKQISSRPTPVQMFDVTNKSRKDANLAAYVINTNLVSAATDRCNDEATRHYYSHVTPDGVQWYETVRKYTKYQSASENIASGNYTAASLEDAFMESPEHKSNILNDKFNEIGIAVCVDGSVQKIVIEFANIQVAETVKSPPAAVSYNPDSDCTLLNIKASGDATNAYQDASMLALSYKYSLSMSDPNTPAYIMGYNTNLNTNLGNLYHDIRLRFIGTGCAPIFPALFV